MITYCLLQDLAVSPVYVVAATRLGLCYLQPATSSVQGLQALRSWLLKALKGRSYTLHLNENHPILEQVSTELQQYFSGELTSFSTPIDLLAGTNFQQRVWKELQRIPYGETKIYADIATAIEQPKAYRAVGSANGQNPICIVIPCHRVVSKRNIGGYSGGLDIKKALLLLEDSKNRS